MHFNQRGDISTLNGDSLKLMDKFTYLGNRVSSTENDINTWLVKAWTAIDRLSVIWNTHLSNKVKRSFFPRSGRVNTDVWTLTKRIQRKLDGNCLRMLRTVLNKSWKQHPTKQQLYWHLPSISKTIQIRRERHAGHCWRSKGELISDVLQWTSSHGRARVGQSNRTYLQRPGTNIGCSMEGLLRAMDDRD